MMAVIFNSLAAANAGEAVLWDFLRTLGRAKEDPGLPTDDNSNLVNFGGGVFVPRASIPVPTRWYTPYPHPTNGTFAVRVLQLFVNLVDVTNADTTISDRAKRIRAALCSGPTITLPSGDTIVNSFWTTDASTTLARWNQLATKLASAAVLPSDWGLP